MYAVLVFASHLEGILAQQTAGRGIVVIRQIRIPQ